MHMCERRAEGKVVLKPKISFILIGPMDKEGKAPTGVALLLWTLLCIWALCLGVVMKSCMKVL